MAYDDLRHWIKALDRAGELKRIRTEADPILEIAEITDRVSKSKSTEGQPPSAVQRREAPQPAAPHSCSRISRAIPDRSCSSTSSAPPAA